MAIQSSLIVCGQTVDPQVYRVDGVYILRALYEETKPKISVDLLWINFLGFKNITFGYQ